MQQEPAVPGPIWTFHVELHLFSRYARGLAEKNVTSHVTSSRPDVTAVQGAHTRCARIKLRSP
jgi:hypothetical protein